jgi:hypothetical protein
MLADFGFGSFSPEQREDVGDAPAPDFVRDLDYERQEGIAEVLRAVASRAPVVLVSGHAGTGKSKLIEYMKGMPGGRRQVVVAPTGVAALALKASTIHSLFRLPVGVVDAAGMPEEERFGRLLRIMRRLVIDEISMVRADLLDGIDRRLRDLRKSDKPFGGVQVVMVGDFLQLPPVVTPEDRSLLSKLGYDTPFAFSAKVLATTPVKAATLKKVWRQSDPEMIKALGAIREGRRTEEALAWLNARCARDHREGAAPLMLTATRAAADAYNASGMSALPRAANGRAEGLQVFEAIADGAFQRDNAILPAPRSLELAPGVRVMAVKNDQNGDYVNGSLGVVTEIDMARDDGPAAKVRFDHNGLEVWIGFAMWTKTAQAWDDEQGAIVENVVGVFNQVPLVRGYAITIHKSQGLSLDDVRVDLGRGAFAAGQLYVALSRARSAEGLSLARPIEPKDVQVDEMLVRFLEWAKTSSNLAFEKPVDNASAATAD